MDFKKIIETNFIESLEAKQETLNTCNASIMAAGKTLLKTLETGNKILICGNGGSASDAQHFATELVMRYETNRQGLPAISLSTDTSLLTAIPNDDSFENIFSRQVSVLGNPDDLLIGISTSGNSANVINAIRAAHDKQLKVLILSGKNGGLIKNMLNSSDTEVCVPSNSTARIQEAHILIIHTLCNMADLKFTWEIQ